MAKMWESQTGSVSFLLSCNRNHGHFGKAPLSRNCFRRFSFNSALFIHGPCQTGSQPMSGR